MSNHHEIQRPSQPSTPTARGGGQASPIRRSAAPDALGLLKALRRRWPLALGLGILLAGVAAGVALVALPDAKYSAKSTLQISSTPPKVIFTTSENDHNDFESFKKTQADLIKSRLVLEAALAAPGVSKLPSVLRQDDPVEWLEKAIQVEKSEGSEIVRIAFRGDDPQEAAKLVNAVTDAYLKKVVDVDKETRTKRYAMLKDLWNKYQDNLKEKRSTLKALTQTAGSSDKQTLALKHQFQIERLATAEKEAAQIRSEIRKLQLEADILRKQQGKAAQVEESIDPGTVVDSLLAQDPGVVERSERVSHLRERYRRLTSTVRDRSDPALVYKAREYDQAVKDLKDYQKQIYPSLTERARAAVAAPSGLGKGSDPELIEERIALMKGLEQSLDADVKRLGEVTGTFTTTTSDLEAAQEEIAHAEQAAKKVGAEVEALNVELQAPDRVRPFEKASVPRTKDDKRIMLTAAAACVAFLSSLAGVSWFEFRARRIDTVDEVVHGIGLRLMGSLPAMPATRKKLPLFRKARPDRERLSMNILIESIDAARTALLHAARAESVRVLMVASACGGEGKTSVASQLAASLARVGRRTLLVDGDLRSPTLHRIFDVAPGPGFCEALRGEAPVDSVTLPTGSPNLSLLTAGACNTLALELLAQDAVRTLFVALRDRFDFVVVDSSPLLPVTDGVLIGQQVDAVLFSILRNVSRAPTVQEAHDRLASFGIPILGAVITGVEDRGETRYGSQDRYLTRDFT